MRFQRPFIIIALSVVLLDQASKWAIRSFLSSPIELFGGFFRVSFVRNFGAGFGILQGQRILLSLISLIAVVLILYYYSSYKGKKLEETAFSLILGGAVGNLIDRIFIGFVTDFIGVSAWPSFNIADSCITVGACLLIYSELRKKN